MSDKDFRFTPPPRRERKEFEPPPWEKDQFEQLARERAVSPEQDETPVPVEGDGQAAEVEAKESATVPAEQAPQEQSQAPVEKKSNLRQVIDENKVSAMLFELKAEEAPATHSMHKAALVAGGVLLLIGLVLAIWAVVMIVVASRRPEQGRDGVFVGLMVLMFGVGFVGIGVWFVFRTLRLQGVL